MKRARTHPKYLLLRKFLQVMIVNTTFAVTEAVVDFDGLKHALNWI